jgi:cytoskeleton protein RodZ
MTQQQELIPMTTGSQLKQQRIKRKLTLAEVARAIGLDEKLLSEIENDQAEHIALVYRKGYIKTYARYLQIPENDIQELILSVDNGDPAVRNIFSEPPKRNPMDKWLRATSYVLASLLIGTLAWQFTHEAVRLSQNGSRLHNVQENIPGSESTTIQALIQEPSGPVNASIAPLGALHGDETGGLDTAEQAWASVSRAVLPAGESRLQISVSADSWIEITDANGQELEMDLLRGGSDKAYHGKPPFRILFGRASAVRLSMDGEPVDLTSYTQDDVAQLTWPQKLQLDNSGLDDN